MRNRMVFGLFSCGVILLLASAAGAQNRQSRPSVPGQASLTFADGRKITIDYSRPKIRDPRSNEPRKVVGNLIPYGEVWRMGANEATTFVTTADLDVGGTRVPAGSYTLFMLAQQDGPWKLIISKKTGEWGIPYPGEAEDLARVVMKVRPLADVVDPFTITLQQEGPNVGILKAAWEKTEASIAVREVSQ